MCAYKRLSLILLLALLCGAAVAQPGAPDAVSEAYFTAHAADEPLRSALRLYLRVGGVVWVAVEWLAAIYLWRGYRLLRRAVRERA